MPWVPFVRLSQFVAISCSRNRKPIVRITNEWPRVRIAMRPSRTANRPATTPATGIHRNGLPPILSEPSPTV